MVADLSSLQAFERRKKPTLSLYEYGITFSECNGQDYLSKMYQ